MSFSIPPDSILPALVSGGTFAAILALRDSHNKSARSFQQLTPSESHAAGGMVRLMDVSSVTQRIEAVDADPLEEEFKRLEAEVDKRGDAPVLVEVMHNGRRVMLPLTDPLTIAQLRCMTAVLLAVMDLSRDHVVYVQLEVGMDHSSVSTSRSTMEWDDIARTWAEVTQLAGIAQ